MQSTYSTLSATNREGAVASDTTNDETYEVVNFNNGAGAKDSGGYEPVRSAAPTYEAVESNAARPPSGDVVYQSTPAGGSCTSHALR